MPISIPLAHLYGFCTFSYPVAVDVHAVTQPKKTNYVAIITCWLFYEKLLKLSLLLFSFLLLDLIPTSSSRLE